MDLSWVTDRLTAHHTDPTGPEGRHKHTWDITVFWRSRPFVDGRVVQARLRAILDPWEGGDLPPELWASEDLARHIQWAPRMKRIGVCGVKVAREFGGCGVGEWR